jgi:hypothetical protein
MRVLRNIRRKKRDYNWIIPWALMAIALIALASCAPGCITPNVSYPCALI